MGVRGAFAISSSLAIVASMALVLGGCSTSSSSSDEGTSDDQVVSGVDNARTDSVVRIVKGMGRERLIAETKIAPIAAESLKAYFVGDDKIVGTQDDRTVAQLAEDGTSGTLANLDSIASVTPDDVRKLSAYAGAHRELGSIRGYVRYPSEALVKVRMIAFRTDGTAFYDSDVAITNEFLFAVPEGEYYVAAYVKTAGYEHFTAAYTPAVPCGLRVGCDDHFAAKVKVSGGAETSGIDMDFLLARRVPAEPAVGQAPGCNDLDYRGRCSTDRKDLEWCEENVPRRTSCAFTQKTCVETPDVGFNCVVLGHD